MPNLILVPQKSKQVRADYKEIERRIRVRAPEVAVFVVTLVVRALLCRCSEASREYRPLETADLIARRRVCAAGR